MNNNLDILIYTTKNCSYCKKAKLLLKKYNQKYIEKNINDNEDRIEMSKLSKGIRTVPQIFINGKHIGGYDEIFVLEKKGELKKYFN